MTSKSRNQKASYPHGLAALDLDNGGCFGVKIGPAKAAQILPVLLAAVGTRQVVAAARADLLHPDVAALVRAAGVHLVSVGPGKDAADHALIALGRQAAARGCTRFVVVTGDHLFKTLAKHGRLEVIVRGQAPVSEELAKAADGPVRRLPHPPNPAAAPARPTPAPAAEPSVVHPAQPRLTPDLVSRTRPAPSRTLLGAVGLAAAGVLLGGGAELGRLLTRKMHAALGRTRR